jgi:hypothetical protein
LRHATLWFDSTLTLIPDNCDAFSVGTTFDVAAKKGLKKRFFVEHIEAPGSLDAATLSFLKTPPN